MPRANWLPLVALCMGGLALGFSLLWESDKPAQRPEDVVAALVGSVAHESPRLPAIDTAPAESAVADFRRRTLNPEPRELPSSLIAISGQRVGRIEPDALVVVEPGTQKKRLTFRLPGAFAVAASPSALLAVGTDRLLVLGPGERTPKSMPRPSLFPGSQLMPDLIDAARVWVRHPRSNSLYGYSIGPSTSVLLPLAETVTLSGAADGSFVGLADGSFLHFTGTGWERLFVQGKRFELPWSNTRAAPLRTLRAQRLDQIYVLGKDGELELYQLEAPLSRLWHRNVSPLPVDIATSGDTVFMLRSHRTPGHGLSWTLQGIHRKRKDVFVPLGGEHDGVEEFRGEWYGRLLARYGLVASPRWVVLGGTGQLRVWDAKTLEPVDVAK